LRIRILCIGRLKDGPERELVETYLARAAKTGKPLGYRGVEEIELRSSSKEEEAARLLVSHGKGVLILLDERGEAWTSAALSKHLARWRDAGEEVADFIIGGAEGTSPALAAGARHTISFGPQTWPHRLVRVMLAEQIYRALSIEAGSPYHRE
jgi:23S rRNA (pseudouridine1915-N3)-methyltransferase